MLVSALIKNEKIETTTAKAKELRPLAEKIITLAKRGDLHARRQVLSVIHDESVVSNLFSEIAPRFASRNGGYTRIVPTRTRRGDAAPMAVIELVERLKKAPIAPKAETKKAEKAPSAPKTEKKKAEKKPAVPKTEAKKAEKKPAAPKTEKKKAEKAPAK